MFYAYLNTSGFIHAKMKKKQREVLFNTLGVPLAGKYKQGRSLVYWCVKRSATICLSDGTIHTLAHCLGCEEADFVYFDLEFVGRLISNY